MSGVVGDFMRKVNSYQHGEFFIAVYEINSPEGADCFYGWESDSGDYIGLCHHTLSYHDPDSPPKFSLCLASSPGDVIFRFDDADGEWLLAVAARLSAHLAKLEMPSEIRKCLHSIVQRDCESSEGNGNPCNDAVSTIRDWLAQTSE